MSLSCYDGFMLPFPQGVCEMGNKAVSRFVSGAVKAACFWFVAVALAIARQVPFPALREFALPTTWDGLAQLFAEEGDLVSLTDPQKKRLKRRARLTED